MSTARTVTETGLDDDDLQVEIEVPAEWQICGNCSGDGSIEDWETTYERGDDIALMAQCPECSGRGSVLTPRHGLLSDGDREAIERRWEGLADDAAEAKAEAQYFGY